MYTLEEHNNTKGGVSIDIRDKTRLSELITHLYNLGFRHYNDPNKPLSELISEFNTRDYLVLPNYHKNTILQLHPRNNNEDAYETRTIDEMLDSESKYYSYYNTSNKYTVIFKGIVTKEKTIISDKDFRHIVISKNGIYSSSGVHLFESSYSNLKELSPTSDEALWLNACADANKYLEKIYISQVKVGDYVYVSIPGLGGKIGKIHSINNEIFSFESDPGIEWAVFATSFVRRCSQKEIDDIDKMSKSNVKYFIINYPDGDCYVECTNYNGGSKINFNSAIDVPNNDIYCTSSFYDDPSYISHSPMDQNRIKWFKECINKDEILDFPLKNNTQILSKDYIEGEYYYSKLYAGGQWNEIIFKYNKDYSKNVYIHITNKRFDYNSCCTSNSFTKEEIRRLATEQEIEWLDACIKANKFLELEDIGKHENVKLTNGYYHLKGENTSNGDYIIKIVDDGYYYLKTKPNLFYCGTKFKINDDSFVNYIITPASNEDASWMDNCINARKLVDKSISNNTPKSKITSQFIKSDVDDLITMPQLEIKKTKITFINN